MEGCASSGGAFPMNRNALGAADWLLLAAAPTFAIMALVTGLLSGPRGHALLGRSASVPLKRNGPNVLADGRLSFCILAEADLPLAKRGPPS